MASMIRLKDFREKEKNILEQVYETYLKKDLEKLVKDGLINSAIAARVCYSEDSFFELLRDKRVFDPLERKKFLLRLLKAKHYSVFAHTPIEFLSNEEISLYKCFQVRTNSRYSTLLSLRHLFEYLDQSESEKIIEKLSTMNHFDRARFFLVRALKGSGYVDQDSQVEEIDDVLRYRFQDPYHSMIVFVYWPDYEKFGHLLVWTDAYSRNFSHQLVRHTYFSFNQRSFRYTKPDENEYITPLAILQNDRAYSLFKALSSISFEVYQDLVEKYSIKKEDARYITISGTKTTIVMSAPLFMYEDFIQKRFHKKAQAEIRYFSLAIKKFLEHIEYL